ncbi:MAG: DUF1653 domain-containing protein [Kiritimatiellae bacterium]|nr:DUF1653 domain-containing protein [Kiritimatiellia bacterium]
MLACGHTKHIYFPQLFKLHICYNGECGLWVRPAKMFFETVERAGKTMKRFEPVEDPE